ncbi:alpha/beta hydrolase-fold protein [Mucilaginibacter sp.]|uniref:alpha/beta hydrolase-fold protein n=1 Tax=Mucilaginibacter sp. TaxID=1882438 RepID=UPI003D15241C
MKKIILSILLVSSIVFTGFAQQFQVSYAPAASNENFTGYVVLYLSKDNKIPKKGMVGFENFPCFSVYVKNVKPSTIIKIDDKATSYPTALSDIERGQYYAQIVWDKNMGGRSIAESPGNMYSEPAIVNITKDTKTTYHILADQVIPALPGFKETDFVKELKVPSALLSKFNNKAVTVDAAVILPKEYYTEPNRKFPVLFKVSGYGGDYHRYSGSNKPGSPIDTIPAITVYLDGNCPLGHCVYANSDNNGPWGDALTTEFIPQLEKQYRCNGAKLLTGHSSGGWTVAWLQTHYPKVFDGCWSSSPDPVDFRSFQKIDLYTAKNMFYAKDSTLNAVATIAGFFPVISMKTIYGMEAAVYRGEQMHSFNAVFSAKGSDGLPQNICSRTTGDIDPAVFVHWKNYDISLYLRTNWEQIKPDLDGKLRISVGNQDNFLLNYAVVLLDGEMKKLNSTFQFAYYIGDHFTVSSPEYQKDGNNFLKQKYAEWLAKNNKK